MDLIRHLIREAHRRSLAQVLGVYLIGAWMAYQVILGLVHGLQLPEWLPGMAVVLFLVGLPIVVATAMVQEPPPPAPRAEDESSGNGSTAAPLDASPGSPVPARDAPLDSSPDPTRRAPRAASLLVWRKVLPAGVAAFALLGLAAAVTVIAGSGRAARSADVASVLAPAGGEPGSVGALMIETNPAGAHVRLAPVLAGEPALVTVEGVTPLELSGLAVGEYLLELELDGHQPLDLLVRVTPEGTLARRQLVSTGVSATPMVVINAGPGPAGDHVPAFLLDRYEVTNAQYSEFVMAGGYTDARFWPDTLLIGGVPQPWQTAMSRFVDRTGMPGPRGWSGGIPPAGMADHPVVGVSWYEAGAFARWAGRELPTAAQWWRAALGDGVGHYPWGDDIASLHVRANFGLEGTVPVGSFPLGTSPFGAHDMAGNAREWLHDGPPGAATLRRLAVGGGWMDPDYMFDLTKAEAFSPDHASELIGFRCMQRLPRDRGVDAW